jgi:hypothetical protein
MGMFGNVKHAEFLSGSNKEDQVFIPRTNLEPSSSSLSYCNVMGVFNSIMTPNVQCLPYLTTLRYVYVICHFWTPVCNVLGYWRHHSVCYTPLFTTPLVVTTISVYNELWPSDVVSRNSPLISSMLSVRWSPSVISLQCFHLGLFSVCLFYLSLLSLSACRAEQKLTAGNQPARSLLASIPAGTHGHVFVQCQDFCFFFLSLFLLW